MDNGNEEAQRLGPPDLMTHEFRVNARDVVVQRSVRGFDLRLVRQPNNVSI